MLVVVEEFLVKNYFSLKELENQTFLKEGYLLVAIGNGWEFNVKHAKHLG